MTYHVTITQCTSYDLDAVRTAVAASLEPLGGMGKFVGKGQRVLVKPNLLASRAPEAAVTTHPAVVQAVVEQVQKAGGVAIIGDSPGGRNVGSSYERLLKRTGMMGVVEATGCEWISFDDSVVDVQAPDAKSFKRFTVGKAVTDADRIIVLPKLKTHQLTYYTGAVKVLYGYIPGLLKAEYHLHTGTDAETFSDLLLDLHGALPPTLAIMDAVVGMEGQGPSNGNPRGIGLILAGENCHALDLVACSVIGFDPMMVPTVRKAGERGVGPRNLGEVLVSGAPIEDIRLKDFAKPRTMLIARIPHPSSPPSATSSGPGPASCAGSASPAGSAPRDARRKRFGIRRARSPPSATGTASGATAVRSSAPKVQSRWRTRGYGG